MSLPFHPPEDTFSSSSSRTNTAGVFGSWIITLPIQLPTNETFPSVALVEYVGCSAVAVATTAVFPYCRHVLLGPSQLLDGFTVTDMVQVPNVAKYFGNFV